MNKYFISFLSVIFFGSAWSQSISQLTITPINPTPSDTIYVISTLTYSGNCSYGLAYSNTQISGDTVLIMPTYCGYGMPTNCITTDTFKLPPLAIGNYTVKIQYHQGSVCPISNFDAVIGETTSAISVSSLVATQITAQSDAKTNIKIYPNPVKESLMIEIPQEAASVSVSIIVIRNILGEVLIRKKVEEQTVILNLKDFPYGIYTLELEGAEGFVPKRFVLIQ